MTAHDPEIALQLVVIRTGQFERARAFYQSLGVELNEERHGNGPVHAAGRVGPTVLEVYPLPAGGTADTGTRLGFAVRELDRVVNSLAASGAQVVTLPQPSPWGLRAVVRDPDGRSVELYEAGEAPD